MNQYAEQKEMMGNINPKALIITDIAFHKRKFELAEVQYHKATLNHDYETLNRVESSMTYHKAIGHGLIKALRYLLAQEAEASGRRVSASMSEFDEAIEEMTSGVS